MKTLKILTCLLTVCLTYSLSALAEESKPQAEGQDKAEKKAGREMGKGNFREGMMGGHEAMIGRMVNNPEMIKQLELTDEQVKILKDSSASFSKENEGFSKQLKEAGLEQAKLMTEQGQVDEAAVMAAVEKTGKIQTEMAKARVKHMLLVKKTLKPEQAAKLREMMQRHIKQMKEAREKGGEGKEEGSGVSKERRERIKKRMEEKRKDKSGEESASPEEGKKTEAETGTAL